MVVINSFTRAVFLYQFKGNWEAGNTDIFIGKDHLIRVYSLQVNMIRNIMDTVIPIYQGQGPLNVQPDNVDQLTRASQITVTTSFILSHAPELFIRVQRDISVLSCSWLFDSHGCTIYHTAKRWHLYRRPWNVISWYESDVPSSGYLSNLLALRQTVARKPLACSYIGSMYHNFWVPLKQFTLIY